MDFLKTPDPRKQQGDFKNSFSFGISEPEEGKMKNKISKIPLKNFTTMMEMCYHVLQVLHVFNNVQILEFFKKKFRQESGSQGMTIGAEGAGEAPSPLQELD